MALSNSTSHGITWHNNSSQIRTCSHTRTKQIKNAHENAHTRSLSLALSLSFSFLCSLQMLADIARGTAAVLA